MSTFTYFAYGSNLLLERLQARCSSARFIGLAVAKGYDIDFSKVSTDKLGNISGKATIFRSENHEVSGALFNIAVADQKKLDEAEGLNGKTGSHYNKLENFCVNSLDGKSVFNCVTYEASLDKIGKNISPYDWYHQLVVAGLKRHNFPTEYIKKINVVNVISDPVVDRNDRIHALQVLKKAGSHFK